MATENNTTEEQVISAPNFVRNIVAEDVKNNKNGGKVVTRFPPEPNGYLHIGHAKSICLNFGLPAESANGKCHLRFDDTNPEKEDVEYSRAIEEDVKWLGFDWAEDLYHASDYFDQLYQYAVALIKKGKAYVCHLSPDEAREYRGTLKEPGKNSPYRDRSIEENMQLFESMKNGELAEGECVLRAKIDMSSPNINMRDPIIYRIRKVHHHRTGDDWCIYPMYDFTHCLSDSIEGITHSVCTLEFEDHRPLYDWVLDELETPCHPQQIEFARLNLDYTIMSKRKLLELVENGYVNGWDDPRMPTISGMRRRGFTPESIRTFCERIGVTKKDSVIETGVLENCIREDLDKKAPRVMAVLDPIKVVIENYPDGQEEMLTAKNHPNDETLGTREIPFCKEIYIERGDFAEEPPKKFFRMKPGGEVRLRYAYIVKCESVVHDEQGNVIEIRCSYDQETRGGKTPDGRKIKGTIHWVSAKHAVDAEVRLYDRLFNVPNPDAGEGDYKGNLNPESLEIRVNCKVEPSLAQIDAEQRYQFERIGYFCHDAKDSDEGVLVFNRVATLRDSWAKLSR
ncbi:MAG: glutamine--tRNA ligase/YqeY domain fusion protein [Gammaproteobacteria bacterium]|nr:MAG: glutamine--tRNA ligase/YqeY domain fusion protein [Gammaproteobacteria bacterium]